MLSEYTQPQSQPKIVIKLQHATMPLVLCTEAQRAEYVEYRRLQGHLYQMPFWLASLASSLTNMS